MGPERKREREHTHISLSFSVQSTINRKLFNVFFFLMRKRIPVTHSAIEALINLITVSFICLFFLFLSLDFVRFSFAFAVWAVVFGCTSDGGESMLFAYQPHPMGCRYGAHTHYLIANRDSKYLFHVSPLFLWRGGALRSLRGQISIRCCSADAVFSVFIENN